MNNPGDNRTAQELQCFSCPLGYNLPLTFWREAPFATAEPSTLYFRDPSDRDAFARLFWSLGYKTYAGTVKEVIR